MEARRCLALLWCTRCRRIGLPTVFGKGLTLGQVRDVALFKINGRGLEGEPRVEVSGKVRTVLQEDKEEVGLYIVKYIPEEVGYSSIHVFWNNIEIPGSPFQVCS